MAEPTPDPIAASINLTDRPLPAHDGADHDEKVRRFVIEAARVLTDLHCTDVIIFDVRTLSDLTDYILIASGTSDRQIKAVGGHVSDLAKQMQLHRFGSERDEATTWLVLDYVNVIVHLFEPATRAHYDLEMMWGDAPRVAWKR
jgi:ribosome-associated protein